MKTKDMENKLKQAFNIASGDLFHGILADCKDERIVMKMEAIDNYDADAARKTQKHIGGKSWLRAPMAALAAALILIVGGIFIFQQITTNRVASIITMDLNPSIQLDVNSKDQVLNARSLNEDGQVILDDMDLNKVDLNVAVNAIIGSMLKNGYMTEEIVTFLVSAENESDQKTSELLEMIVIQLETLMENNGLESTILSQKLAIDADVKAIAEMYQISAGKAYLVKHIHGVYPTIPVEVLAAMGIDELVDLFSNTIVNDEDIELHGSKAVDTHQELFDRALVLTWLFEKWQLDPAGIQSATIELDDDRLTYDVEVIENNRKFQALVDAKTGEILDEEWDDDYVGPTEPGQAMMLSPAEARQMVISRFGGIIQKIEYTYDDSNPMYKGEALKAGYRVVFEINARTRNWYKWATSNDNSWDDFAHALPDMITMDQAADSVIRKSGHSGTFIQKIDFLWDDSEPIYQGEAFRKGIKYSFEIYAYGGGYQKWDIDYDDDTWEDQYYNVQASPTTAPVPTLTPEPTGPAPTVTPEPTATPAMTVKPETSEPGQTTMLSAAEARQMVISRFGGIIQKIEYTYDDTNPMYKGEALKAGYRVVFEINARTRTWYKWDTGNDNSWDDFAYALPDMITMNQAADSVIRKSGHSGTFIQKIDFLWDDSEPIYQGEAFRKGIKYSFEIYAYGGSYQKWDIDYDDDTWSDQYYNVH